MNQIFRDTVTGRAYTLDDNGRSVWVDDTAATDPAAYPQPLASATPSGPGHARSSSPAPRRRGGLLLPVLAAAATGVVGLVVGIAVGAVGVGGTTSSSEPSARSVASAPTAAPTPAATTSTSQDPPPAPSVGKDNFDIEIKTLSKQCFGSAGCSVDVRLQVNADSSALGTAAEITVKVTGDESGPLLETISIDESGSYSPPELSMSTKSNATKIEATITDVETF